MNIYLIGFMGSGKTTVSKQLSERLGFKLVDTDSYIEEKEGKAIKDIFALYGEGYFRDLETKTLSELKETENTVVSCGGGIVLRKENVALMREGGKTVLLNAAPKTIYDRVKNSKDRPILNGHMNVEYIAGLMEKRREAYDYAADIVVNTDNKSLHEVIQEIIEKCKE